MNYILSKPGGGQAAILVPGGVPEVLEVDPNTHVLTLKNRKVFIKLAIQSGCFYWTGALGLLLFLFTVLEKVIFSAATEFPGSFFEKNTGVKHKCYRVSASDFFGRGIFESIPGIIPYRVPINVVDAICWTVLNH